MIESVDGWLAKEEAAALHAAASSVPPGQWIVEIGASSGRSTAAMVTGKRPGVPVLTIDPYASPSATRETMRAFCKNMDRVGTGHEVQLFWGTSEEAARSRSLVFAVAAARARVLDARDRAAAPRDVRILANAQEGPAPCGPRVFRVDGPKTSSWIGEADVDAHEPEIGLLFIDGLHDEASVLLDIDLWEPLVAEGGTVVFHDAFFRGGVTHALFKRHLLNSEFRYERSLVNTSIFRRVGRLETVDVLLSGLRMTTRTTHYARNIATSIGVRNEWRWLQRLLPPLPDFEYY
jgi:predicted O-methyltransferase YrrM